MSALFSAAMVAVWIAFGFWQDRGTAEPLEQTTHRSGFWALMFLLATLSLTPLRRLLDWAQLARIRRTLGLLAFAFLLVHLGMFVAEQDGQIGVVASEIAKRFYLAIGFAVVLGLAILAATSFDAAMRRLGRHWHRLHKLAYPLTALGLWHFFLQSKSDVTDPVLLTGIFLLILALRLKRPPKPTAARMAIIVALAVSGAISTAAIETAWYALATGIPAERVFAANFDFTYRIAPAWYVGGVALTLLLPLAWRRYLRS